MSRERPPDIRIVRLPPDLGREPAQFAATQAELDDATAQEHFRLVLDLTKAVHMHSSGVGLLVAVWRQAQERSGTVHAFGVSGFVERVFAPFGMPFERFESEEAAVRGFEAG